MDIFGLGEGFSNETFNNLALNEMRAEKDAKLDQLFNMGSGLKIFDYMEAANLLLTRTYPEIEDGSQSKPIFIPETFHVICCESCRKLVIQQEQLKDLLDSVRTGKEKMDKAHHQKHSTNYIFKSRTSDKKQNRQGVV